MPNIITILVVVWLCGILISLGKLERKLDRILKHLGLDDEVEAPKVIFNRPRSDKRALQDEL